VKKVTAIVALLALTSCAGVPEAHIAADRAIHDAIAPEYREYVEADERLPRSLKDIKLRTLKRWSQMIEEFERGAK
jgi:predicted lipoprotein